MADIRTGCIYVTKRKFWKSAVVLMGVHGDVVRLFPNKVGGGPEFTMSKNDFSEKYEHAVIGTTGKCSYCIDQEDYTAASYR